MPAIPDLSPEVAFGRELRKLRAAQNWSLEALGAKVGYSGTMVGYFERAKRPVPESFVAMAEEALGINGELAALWKEINPKAAPKWFRAWPKIEAAARVIRSWEPLLVPGLLQTEAYAREVLSASPLVPSDQVEEEVAVRMRRRKILEGDNPPQVWDLVDESVLHRPIGGPGAHTAQLHHILAAMEEHDNVTVQLVPLTTGCTLGLMGAFALAQIPGHVDTVLLESSGGGRVSTDPKLVSQHQKRYDTIRANARPYRESLRLIKEEIDKWTNRGPE